MNPVEAKLLHLVQHNQPTTTTFLTIEEQSFLQSQTNDVLFVGGFKNPERKRAALYGANSNLVKVYEITFPKDYLTLRHQQILGNLLALGIKRDHIGDILVDQHAFVISTELSPYIEQSLKQIDNVPITLKEVDLSTYIYEQAYTLHNVIIDSMRLDLVVSKLAGLSRDEAKELIVNGDVKINHKVLTKPTKQLKEEDVLSIRRFGRAMIFDATNRSKKGKIVLKYKKYQ